MGALPHEALSMRTLAQLADDLASMRTTSRELVERCLHNCGAKDGEGARVFLKVRAEQALADAERIDRERTAGRNVPKYAGIPISTKDLFDIAGDITTAGSTLLRDAPAAART